MRISTVATLAALTMVWSGSAWALTPISGRTQVQTHAFIYAGATSDTDSDADVWSGTPQASSAFATSSVGVDNADLTGGGASLSGDVGALWAADGSSGSVKTRFGWAFSNQGDIGLLGADFNGLNPNWSYSFRADRDGLLIWQGQVRADPSLPGVNNTFGLTGWDLLINGVKVIDLTDPSGPLPRTGDGDFALVAGETYTLELTNFSNIAGYEFGSIQRGRVLGDFFWQIQEEPAIVPEPGGWALMILGFGLIGAAARARRFAAA